MASQSGHKPAVSANPLLITPAENFLPKAAKDMWGSQAGRQELEERERGRERGRDLEIRKHQKLHAASLPFAGALAHSLTHPLPVATAGKGGEEGGN